MYQKPCNGAIRPGKLERFDKVKYTKSTNLDCKAFEIQLRNHSSSGICNISLAVED
jgi:hypothetical protein